MIGPESWWTGCRVNTWRWPDAKQLCCFCVENQLVRAGVDQQIGWLAVDADGHDHFVQRSVVHAHSPVSGHLHRGTVFGRGGNRQRHDGEKYKHVSQHPTATTYQSGGGCSVRCPQRIFGGGLLCAEDSARYSPWRAGKEAHSAIDIPNSAHNPVGQSINSHGTLNRFDRCAASALTPNTSVA